MEQSTKNTKFKLLSKIAAKIKTLEQKRQSELTFW